MGIILVTLIKSHYQKLQTSLFEIFIDLDEKFIKKIYKRCVMFVRRLERESERGDEVSAVDLKKEEDENADDMQNHKIKKLKKDGLFDKIFMAQMVGALLGVVGFLVAFEIVDMSVN